MMENILTDDYCLSPYTCKCCTIIIKQFDGLKFDGLAGKHQKRQNFPLYGPMHAQSSAQFQLHLSTHTSGSGYTAISHS